MHNLLPRVLGKLAKQSSSTNDSVSEMHILLQQEGLQIDELADNIGDNELEWQELLGDLLDSKDNMSHAELNRKRKRLTFAAFLDPQIVSKIMVTEALASPSVKEMHLLFSRTHAITTLQRLPQMAEDERSSLQTKCSVKFTAAFLKMCLSCWFIGV